MKGVIQAAIVQRDGIIDDLRDYKVGAYAYCACMGINPESELSYLTHPWVAARCGDGVSLPHHNQAWEVIAKMIDLERRHRVALECAESAMRGHVERCGGSVGYVSSPRA
jgi:hypothetical protein